MYPVACCWKLLWMTIFSFWSIGWTEFLIVMAFLHLLYLSFIHFAMSSAWYFLLVSAFLCLINSAIFRFDHKALISFDFIFFVSARILLAYCNTVRTNIFYILVLLWYLYLLFYIIPPSASGICAAFIVCPCVLFYRLLLQGSFPSASSLYLYDSFAITSFGLIGHHWKNIFSKSSSSYASSYNYFFFNSMLIYLFFF